MNPNLTFEDMTESEKGAVEGLLMMAGVYWTMDRSKLETGVSKPTTDSEQNVAVTSTPVESPVEIAPFDEKSQSMQPMTVNDNNSGQMVTAKAEVSSQTTALKEIPIPELPINSGSGQVMKAPKRSIPDSGEENKPPIRKTRRKRRPMPFSDDSTTDEEMYPDDPSEEPDFVGKFEMVERWVQTVNESINFSHITCG